MASGSMSPRACKEVFEMSLDDRLAMTSTPVTADGKGGGKDILFATATYGGQVRRSSRRSSDILNATKQLDDDVRNRKEFDTIRETKSAMIVTDDIGAVASVNEYTILKELGKGSFAEVKLCKRLSSMGGVSGSLDDKAEEKSPSASPVMMTISEDEECGQELYAIKIFSKSILMRRRNYQRNGDGRMAVTTDMDKVQREIAIMKKLIHPNLVRLYEVIDDAAQDALYIVLEYVTGGAIMDYDQEERKYVYRRSRKGVMSEVHAARCIVDVMAGLVYLHLHHICHRDLKPENVLLDSRGRCKIADFGVAHYFEEEEAKVQGNNELQNLYRSNSRGLLKNTDGTWCFWAPEMCRAGGPFSGYSCDIWAAGVCLWVFIFGSLPFMEDSPDDLFDRIVVGDLEWPERDVSTDLVDLLTQLLKKLPRDRISLEDALDHSWCQLADEEGDEVEVSMTMNGTGVLNGKSLRARATSFSRVYVTEDDINSAIRTVNNFVLVSKLKKKLTQKLQEARASLSRGRSPVATPDSSRSTTPVTGNSRATTPVQSLFERARAFTGSPSPVSVSPSRSPQQKEKDKGLAKWPTGGGEEDDATVATPGITPSTDLSTRAAQKNPRKPPTKRSSCSVM